MDLCISNDNRFLFIFCYFSPCPCSHAVDESPSSDVKMDISETTTSQESPITSPDFEIEKNLLADVSQREGDHPAHDKGVIPKRKSKCKTGNEITSHTLSTSSSSSLISTRQGHGITALLADHSDLDNRNSGIECEDNFQHRSNTNVLSRSNCQLTLTESHPLMSPVTSANSDSDHSTFNYPDVMPENEPLLSDASMVPSTASIARDDSCNQNAAADNLQDIVPSIGISAEQPHRDFLSSGEESDPDLSQYQASVEPSFQSVSLVATNSANKLRLDESPKSEVRRIIPLSNELLCGDDDASSAETASNQSFDDDCFHDDFDDYLGDPRSDNHLISASVSSSMMDDVDASEATAAGLARESSSLPQYSAVDEAKDARGWQRITLPDGKTRDIDMKVIEPYKRVLSHGGYLKAGGHNAIVVFSACYLPDRSRKDYHYVMDNLFLYVVKTLEQLVTEDYVLIYLHGGSTRSNVPPFPWLKKCYQLLDRRLRKSLKNLFMVHPTFWLKSIVWMARPFIR